MSGLPLYFLTAEPMPAERVQASDMAGIILRKKKTDCTEPVQSVVCVRIFCP